MTIEELEALDLEQVRRRRPAAWVCRGDRYARVGVVPGDGEGRDG